MYAGTTLLDALPALFYGTQAVVGGINVCARNFTVTS
jgi:hypothetical protein